MIAGHDGTHELGHIAPSPLAQWPRKVVNTSCPFLGMTTCRVTVSRTHVSLDFPWGSDCFALIHRHSLFNTHGDLSMGTWLGYVVQVISGNWGHISSTTPLPIARITDHRNIFKNLKDIKLQHIFSIQVPSTPCLTSVRSTCAQISLGSKAILLLLQQLFLL